MLRVILAVLITFISLPPVPELLYVTTLLVLDAHLSVRCHAHLFTPTFAPEVAEAEESRRYKAVAPCPHLLQILRQDAGTRAGIGRAPSVLLQNA